MAWYAELCIWAAELMCMCPATRMACVCSAECVHIAMCIQVCLAVCHGACIAACMRIAAHITFMCLAVCVCIAAL